MANPNIALRMPTVKAWQLKYWAFLTGAQTSGSKSELLRLLTNKLDTPSITNGRTKIVSVDMGIRNLAFCAIEAPSLDSTVKEIRESMPSPTRPTSSETKQEIKVTAWKRLDLTLPSEPATSQESTDEASPEDEEETSTKSAFTPTLMAPIALRVTQEILSHNPTTILIERQRFRSGGAAAIQEWTVRVNMLESMIWACLETLKSLSQSQDPFPSIHAISPAQVVNFLSTRASASLLPPALFSESNEEIQRMLKPYMSNKTKLEKKDKVDIVRKWIRKSPDMQYFWFNDQQAAIDVEGAVSNMGLWKLRLDEAAMEVAEGFKVAELKNRRGSRPTTSVKKLDDVADCLLQAVTWVKWEENRRVLGEFWKKAVEEKNRDRSGEREMKPSKVDYPFGFN